MDLKRIYSYKEKSDREIKARITTCRKTLSNTINHMARQELVEEIRFLKKILNERTADTPKKVNRIKDAPTIGAAVTTRAGRFQNNKFYI